MPCYALLRADRHGATVGQRIAWLRAWMSAMSQPRNGEQRLYVKLDAWHIFDLPILRRAFPETPWIFLYRNPGEVMASAVRNTGSFLVQDLIDTNMSAFAGPADERLAPAEYAARVLATIMRAALESLGLHGRRAIEYSRLPDAVITGIAAHCGLLPTAAQIESMNARTNLNAKTPQLCFETDSLSKQRDAGAGVRALCTEHLDAVYQKVRSEDPDRRTELWRQ